MTEKDKDTSRFVWKPGDIVILPPTVPPVAADDEKAKAVLADLQKLAQPDGTQKGEHS
jgi:hypothetical protein